MTQYLVRRLIAMVPTAILISLFVFFIMRIMPGDVALLTLAGPNSDQTFTQEQLDQARETLGLNKPLPVQYLNWIEDLFIHKGGDSLRTHKPVYDELLRRIPLTFQLALMSIVFAHLIAIPAGVYSALKRNTPLDHVVRFFAIIGLATPSFWVGIMLILFLVKVFNYSVPLGYVNPFQDPWKNFQQQIFPAIVLGSALSASIARMTRATMLETLSEDYVRTAWSKGLRQSQVIIRHALRNSLLPVMTISALQIGALIAGTVITEEVFSLPGIGRYLVDAIFERDYTIVQTIVLLFGLAYMFVNLLTDLAYAVVDPRIRYS